MKANKWNGEYFTMKLRAGNKAKHFSITDVFGNVINTTEYKNKKILLSFYRYQSCPLCNLRINKIIQKYPLYKENNLEIISFFQSPKESMLEFMDKQDCPFPIIADPEKKMYKQYGIESSFLKLLIGLANWKSSKEAFQKGFYPGKVEGDMKTVPADFLIDENFTIRKAFYGSHIGDHIPFEDIEKFINGSVFP